MMALTWELMKGLRKNKTIIYLLLITIPLQSFAQNNNLGVLFYNVENLFDIENDSLKQDDEFTPDGLKHWTYARYSQKLKNISKVIYESGKWNPPAIIGLCEVENDKVLKDLIWKTGLNNLDYQLIHHESPDVRGIDAAILYRQKIFDPLESIPIKVDLGQNSRPTRDILYTYGLAYDTIPLHVFVAHFPSRYGGVQNTKVLRYKAAKVLNDTIESILSHDPNANIIAMGDFNDNPKDESMLYLVKNGHLKNLSLSPKTINHSAGTIKHQYEWTTFDQFLVSSNLVSGNQLLKADEAMKILDFQFLQEKDQNNTGKKTIQNLHWLQV